MIWRLALSVMLAFLVACATTETAPATVGVAVAEAPCDAGKAPKVPTFPADVLRGDEDIFTLGKVLWADRLARRAYQRQAEAFIAECTKRAP